MRKYLVSSSRLFHSSLIPFFRYSTVKRIRDWDGSEMERVRGCSFVGRKISAKPVTGSDRGPSRGGKCGKMKIQRDATRLIYVSWPTRRRIRCFTVSRVTFNLIIVEIIQFRDSIRPSSELFPSFAQFTRSLRG